MTLLLKIIYSFLSIQYQRKCQEFLFICLFVVVLIVLVVVKKSNKRNKNLSREILKFVKLYIFKKKMIKNEC